MGHRSNQQDHDRGYKICETCKTRALVFQAGYDCESWEQCKICDSWVVSKDEFEKDGKL